MFAEVFAGVFAEVFAGVFAEVFAGVSNTMSIQRGFSHENRSGGLSRL